MRPRCSRDPFHVLPALILCVSTAVGADANAPVVVETTMVGIDDALNTGVSVSELEFTYRWSRVERGCCSEGSTGDPVDDRVSLGAVTFTRGLGRRLDLTASTFGVSYTHRDEPSSGGRDLGDLFVDVKWRFHGSGVDGLHLAYRPGLSVPIGEEDGARAPGLGFWTVSQTFLATLVKGRWALGGEALVAHPIEAKSQMSGSGFAGVGAGYQITARVKPEVELSYVRDFLDDEPDIEVVAVTGGVVVNFSDAIRLDLGLRRGIWTENAAQQFSMSVNVSMTLGKPPG